MAFYNVLFQHLLRGPFNRPNSGKKELAEHTYKSSEGRKSPGRGRPSAGAPRGHNEKAPAPRAQSYPRERAVPWGGAGTHPGAPLHFPKQARARDAPRRRVSPAPPWGARGQRLWARAQPLRGPWGRVDSPQLAEAQKQPVGPSLPPTDDPPAGRRGCPLEAPGTHGGGLRREEGGGSYPGNLRRRRNRGTRPVRFQEPWPVQG